MAVCSFSSAPTSHDFANSSSHQGSSQAPWCSLGSCGEQYCLVWESRYLRDLGSALDSLVDGLFSMVAQEALKYTVLSGREDCSQAVMASLITIRGTGGPHDLLPKSFFKMNL